MPVKSRSLRLQMLPRLSSPMPSLHKADAADYESDSVKNSPTFFWRQIVPILILIGHC